MTLKAATTGIRRIAACTPMMDPWYPVLEDPHTGAIPTESLYGCLWHGRHERYFDSEYPKSYFGQRLNTRSPITIDRSKGEQLILEDFPGDGKIVALGIKGGYFEYHYTEGPKDKAYMEAKDREYLQELLSSTDPKDRALFEHEIATLDLTLPHHQALKAEFGPYSETHEATSPSRLGASEHKHTAAAAPLVAQRERERAARAPDTRSERPAEAAAAPEAAQDAPSAESTTEASRP